MIVKDLLLKALSRANHIEDGTPADARELNKARSHFNAALSTYSDSNLITAFQRVLEMHGREECTIGKYNMKRGKYMHVAATISELPDASRLTVGKDFGHTLDDGAYLSITVQQRVKSWTNTPAPTPREQLADLHCTDYMPDIIVPDMERIVAVMAKRKSDEGPYFDLEFNALSSFYSTDSWKIYCTVPIGDNKVKLLLPKAIDSNYELKVVYNASMKFKDTDYLELPEVYKELLTLATTVGLLSEDADADPAQLANFRTMLTALEGQVAMNNATNRRIMRKDNDLIRTNVMLRNGTFIFRR